MAEHHALRVVGGAGGVHEHGEVFAVGPRIGDGDLAVGHDIPQGDRAQRHVHGDDLLKRRNLLSEGGELMVALRRAEQQFGLALGHEPRHLGGLEPSVHRHGHGAQTLDGEERHRPPHRRLGDHPYPVAGADPLLGQPRGQLPRQIPQLAVRGILELEDPSPGHRHPNCHLRTMLLRRTRKELRYAHVTLKPRRHLHPP